MSNLILREEKGSPLTHTEMDNNIKTLNRGGRLIDTIYYDQPGTFEYVKKDYVKFIVVEMVGGGGGSGGCAATITGQYLTSSPGGGAGYSKKKILYDDLLISETVIIGDGGIAGIAGNNAGGTGGTTSFGTHSSATGGGGGGGSGTNSGTITTSGHVGLGGSGVGDLVLNGCAGRGHYSSVTYANTSVFGRSHLSHYGDGAYGVGNRQNSAAKPGIDGNSGIVIIHEYE